MSLAAALKVLLRGASFDLGTPARVELPFSNLEITRTWTAIPKSSTGRNGFSFFEQVQEVVGALVLALIWFCMLRFLSSTTPRDLAELTMVGVQFKASRFLIHSSTWAGPLAGIIGGIQSLWSSVFSDC